MPTKRNWPHGKLTLLFTDVQDPVSIKRAPGIGNAIYQTDMLQPHFECLREAIQENQGHEFGTPAGDSLLVVFQYPDEALACARAMQLKLAATNLSRTDTTGKVWPMAVRIGVHTAEQQCSPDAYNGPDADYAARVTSLGKGGQVLISATTFDQSQSKERYTLFPWPNRYLKGIEGSGETVYEMLWYDGQKEQEPGLRWLPDWYGRELNKFIGRAQLLAEIRQWLRESRYPLLTLQGPGGIGKTRLAAETVLEVCGHFAGGTAFVALDRAITGKPEDVTPEQLAVAIADAIEAPLELQQSAETKLIHYLRGQLARPKQMLLILDNWESASNPGTLQWLGDLLTVPGLRCLATSRVVMGISNVGQAKITPPLAIPQDPADALETFEGYTLFVERALQRAPDADLSDRAAMVRILQATSGSALGIELVAARVVDYPYQLERLAVGLEQSLLDWQKTRPDLGDLRLDRERHQSLEACLDWSLHLLPQEEQAAFPRLGLFAADFDPQTAQTLFAIPADWLLRWRRYHLLESGKKTFRYALLPVVREYARLRLQPQSAAWQSRYVAYYAQLATANQNINHPEKKAVLDAEWRNALEAAELASQAKEVSALLSLSDGLAGFLSLSIYGEEAMRLHDLARRAATRVNNRQGEANCIKRLGDLALARSNYETARQRYEEALPMYRMIGDVLGEANCLRDLGDLALARSNYEMARQHYEQALSLYRQVSSVLGEANCIKSLGDLAMARFNYETARQRYEEALPLYRQVSSVLGEANCLRDLGDLALARSNYETARQHYEEALPLYRQVSSVLGEANCLRDLGDLALARSNYETARQRYEEALPMYRMIGDVLGKANCIRSLGDLALRCSDHAGARQRYDAALFLYRQVSSVLGEANCIKSLGDLALARFNYETARQRYEEALPLYRMIGDVLGEANCIKRLGDLELRRDRSCRRIRDFGDCLRSLLVTLARSNYETARQHYEQALSLYRQVSSVLGEANCIKSLGDLAMARFNYETARQRYEEALPMYRMIGDVLGEANCLRDLGDLAHGSHERRR